MQKTPLLLAMEHFKRAIDQQKSAGKKKQSPKQIFKPPKREAPRANGRPQKHDNNDALHALLRQKRIPVPKPEKAAQEPKDVVQRTSTRTSSTRTTSTRRTSSTRASSTRTTSTRVSSTRTTSTRASSTRASSTRASSTRASSTRTSSTRASSSAQAPTTSAAPSTSTTSATASLILSALVPHF